MASSTPIRYRSNGSPASLDDLVARARGLHTAFTDHEIEIVGRIESPGKLAIAFRHRARHTGPWQTPLGELAPTGRIVTGLGIDLLTVTDQQISSMVPRRPVTGGLLAV